MWNWDSGALSTKSSKEMFYSHHKRHPKGAGNKNRCLEMSYFYHSLPIHLQVPPVCCWNLQKVYFWKDSKDEKLNLKKKFSEEVLELYRNHEKWWLEYQKQSKKGGTMYFSLNVNRIFPQKVIWIFDTSPFVLSLHLYNMCLQNWINNT